MKRGTAIGIWVACAMWAVAACSEQAQTGQPPGGSAGSGGHEEPGLSCGAFCEAKTACDGSAPENCEASCREEALPNDLVAACAACLGAVACDAAEIACRLGPACRMAWDLEVRGDGLDALEGIPLRVMVAEAIEGEAWVDDSRDVLVSGGSFLVEIPGALRAGWDIPFDVVVIADVDRDGACKSDVDRAWRIPLGLPVGPARVSMADATPETPDCRFWDGAPHEIVLEGVGLQGFEGRYVIAAAAWIGPDFMTLTRYVTEPIRNGTVHMGLGAFGDVSEELLETSEFWALWMIDLDGDWRCSRVDAGGAVLLPSDQTVERRALAGPAKAGTAPCDLLRGL